MRTLTLSLLALAAAAGSALAHPATEQYIPIGQSPGAITMRGEVTTPVEPAAAGREAAFTMSADNGSAGISYEVGPNTRIYIDRSAQGQVSTRGSLADLQQGRAIEVCLPNTQARTALWIKIRPAQ